LSIIIPNLYAPGIFGFSIFAYFEILNLIERSWYSPKFAFLLSLNDSLPDDNLFRFAGEQPLTRNCPGTILFGIFTPGGNINSKFVFVEILRFRASKEKSPEKTSPHLLLSSVKFLIRDSFRLYLMVKYFDFIKTGSELVDISNLRVSDLVGQSIFAPSANTIFIRSKLFISKGETRMILFVLVKICGLTLNCTPFIMMYAGLIISGITNPSGNLIVISEVFASKLPPSPVTKSKVYSDCLLLMSELQVTVNSVISEHGRTNDSDSTGVGSASVAILILYLPGVAGAIIPVAFEVIVVHWIISMSPRFKTNR